MQESLDSTRLNIKRDETVIALMDALAEIDADESLYPAEEADLVTAQGNARALFEQAEAEAEAVYELVAEVTLNEVAGWLAKAPVEAVRSHGAMSVQTIDRTVPELTAAGYAAEVEFDADVDSDARLAEVSVTMRPITDDPVVLVVRVVGSDGSAHSARVNRYGLAIATGVPIDDTTPLQVTWLQR